MAIKNPEPIESTTMRIATTSETLRANDEAFAEALSDSDQLTAELAAANDRALRLQAEMQNLRNRTSREIADERRYAALPVLRDLLPVLDNINRAIEAAEKAGEAENLLAGFRLVRQQLEDDPQPAPVRADRRRGRAVRSEFSRRRFCSSRRPTCRPTT